MEPLYLTLGQQMLFFDIVALAYHKSRRPVDLPLPEWFQFKRRDVEKAAKILQPYAEAQGVHFGFERQDPTQAEHVIYSQSMTLLHQYVYHTFEGNRGPGRVCVPLIDFNAFLPLLIDRPYNYNPEMRKVYEAAERVLRALAEAIARAEVTEPEYGKLV